MAVHLRTPRDGFEALLSHKLGGVEQMNVAIRERLDALAPELPEEAPALEVRTLSARCDLLESLAAGSTEETDFPAARLLAEAEALRAAVTEGKPWFGSEARGEHWLTLPAGRGTAPVRLLVPSTYDPARPAPLVLALHGGFVD